MAIQTLILGVVGDSSGQARVEADIDDTTDPLDFNVIAVRVVNNMSRPCFVDIQRGSGTSWFTVQVSANSTQSRNTGGPVRKLSDIPNHFLRTV